MFSSRLFWRIFGAYAVLTVLSACLLASILSSSERAFVIQRIQRRLHDAAVILKSRATTIFEQGPGSTLQRQLVELGRENDTRITLIDDDGIVIGDSDEVPSRMNNHRDREELVEARRNGFGVSQRVSPTLGIPMMYYALRVGEASSPVGFVRVATTMESVNDQVSSVQRLIWSTSAIVGLAAIAITSLIVSRVMRPVKNLTDAAQAIANGELARTVDVSSKDEFGTLADAFNLMSNELASRIDELQRQQRILQENSELLETVLGSMIEGVVVVDADKQVLFANGTARKLFDLETMDAVGRPIWEASRHLAIEEVIQRSLEGASPQIAEFEIPRTKSIISLTATRLPGEPCPGVVLVLHDMTELRRLENVRREFVSNVSHELKTPLTSIQAYTETLLNGAIDDPDHNRQFLQRIEEQADRLHALILDVLSLARIESEQDAFDVVPVSVRGLVEACIEEHRTIAESKNVSLQIETSEEEIHVLADSEGLRTILDNLVDNAINYTPENGQVTIRTRLNDGMAIIEVSDTGMGIAREHQDRIFERFYRVDQARSREIGGTGLGLSIVKHLAQVFGGDVAIVSELGQGSTFRVSLPLAAISKKLEQNR